MTGETVYKEFDTASVMTGSTSINTKETVLIGRFAVRKRELLLGVIALAALLCVLVLAIVLAARASDTDSSGTGSHTSSASKQAGGKLDVAYCYTPECLQAATYQKPIINDKIDPCVDFYTFACGHYRDHHEQTPLLRDVTPENEIDFLNERRLAYLTLYPIENNQPNSYERKFQEFISSCSNHFDKMDLRGKPMIDHIIKPLGGWWVFGDDVLKSFSLQDSLEKVHIDFWTDAFFNLFVKTNINQWNEKIVELDFGGLGLSYNYYGDGERFDPIHSYYKRYLSTVAIMLSVDNAKAPDNDRIKTFTEDVFELEKTIATILSRSTPLLNPHHENNLVTLDELNTHMNGSIDMIHYMKTMFNEYPSKFDGNTKVAVSRLDYFDTLGPILEGYLKTEEGKRKIHNYLMWRAIENYVNDLSWDYVHSARKLNHVLYGDKDDSSGFNRCFYRAMSNFQDVMNALFAKHFVKEEGKLEAEKMLENIKPVLLKGIDNMPWMTRSNKDFAMKKIRESLYKTSYPKEILDEDILNSKYALADIKIDDYFGSVISLHKLKRQQYNTLVGKPGSRTEWAYQVYYPQVQYYNPWHELTITSSFLQNPMFSPKGPKYYNYGGVGSVIAQNLIHAIDEIGAEYKEDGSHFGNWWTQTTRKQYAKIRQCAVDSQRDEVLGPFMTGSGQLIPINATKYADDWTPTLLADASGARLSFQAYRNLMKKEGIEKLPPGFEHFSRDQMFFLSFAQSYCQNTADALKYSYLMLGEYPTKNRVNLALQNVPEFQEAFMCPKKPKPCLLFDL